MNFSISIEFSKVKNIKLSYIGLIIIFASIAIDQLTKAWCIVNLEQNVPFKIIDGFFHLELAFNTGAAWSSFDGQFWFLMLMTLLGLIIFGGLFLKADFKTKKFYSLGISLMIGGLFGNFLDRVFQQDNAVVDFLTFYIYGEGKKSFPHFNVADMCLVIGVALFAIDMIFFESKRLLSLEKSEVEQEVIEDGKTDDSL